MAKLMIKDKNGKWQPLDESIFTNEAELQRLMLENPELIPIDDLGEDIPPMLVVGREINIPSIGYIDLLCVDETGLVTVVECKLNRNSEVKRKVVGQILSYAAHLKGYSYFSFEELANNYLSSKAPKKYKGLTFLDAVEKFLKENKNSEDEEEISTDYESFKRNLEECLRLGKFRLLIIVDKVNNELSKIVEYLNSSSGDAFAIHCCEMAYFKNGQTEVIAPRMIGFGTKILTPQAKKWDRAKFEEDAIERLAKESANKLFDILTWSENNFSDLVWGRGKVDGSFTPKMIVNGKLVSLFNAYTNGALCINFESWKTAGLSETQRENVRVRLNDLSKISINKHQINKYPSFSINNLSSADITSFKEIIIDVAHQLSKLNKNV